MWSHMLLSSWADGSLCEARVLSGAGSFPALSLCPSQRRWGGPAFTFSLSLLIVAKVT